MYTTKVKLTIRGDGRGFFGPGVAELMEYIEKSGSVKEACRRMGVSYSKGRYILKRAEEQLQFALIDKKQGGSGGGAAKLTAAGREYLLRYRALEIEVDAFAREKFEEAFITTG